MSKAKFITIILLFVRFLVPEPLAAQQPETMALKQAVDLALKNSREVTLAQVRYNVAHNEARVNAYAFRPNLFTGSGAAWTYGFPQTLGGAAPSIINLSYLQTVFNPSLRGLALASSERAEAQRLELDKARNSVMLQTSSAYLELGKVRHSLELARNLRQSSNRILNFTKERVSEGVELPIEVTRAELAQARLEQQIVQLESRETTLAREMAQLLGLPRDRRIEVESPVLNADQERESELVERALNNNLDLRQAEYERRARAHRVNGELGMKWPTVELFGQYGLFARSFNNFDKYFQTFQRNNLNIGVQLRIPIVTGDRPAVVALARSELTAAEVELKYKRQNLELEVGRQYQRLRELDSAREVARLELKLAQENLQLVQARFEEGRANLRDVERARLDENSKWVAFLDSDYDSQKAQLDLLNITGDLGTLFR